MRKLERNRIGEFLAMNLYSAAQSLYWIVYCTAHLLSLLFNVYVQLAWEPSAAKITEKYSCHVTYGQSYSDPIPS